MKSTVNDREVGSQNQIPGPLLPRGHYGCGLECGGFIGTLPAVKKHERICRWLGLVLPKDLEHDLVKGDENELALPLLEIVELLHHPLSVLQKTPRDKLASLSLVASDEILSLEPTNRHPAPSQKLPMLKQPNSPAAPT